MITELTPASEQCTAVMTSHLESGENFDGAVLIGIYSENAAEIWIEFHGQRLNIQRSDVDAFCKQLKRAAKLASGKEGDRG